jgi:hypothetical protein
MSQASFTLTSDAVDESRRRQNHDLVSFESGDINTEVRSNKQVLSFAILAHLNCFDVFR